MRVTRRDAQRSEQVRLDALFEQRADLIQSYERADREVAT
jgi:hypothetical protein